MKARSLVLTVLMGLTIGPACYAIDNISCTRLIAPIIKQLDEAWVVWSPDHSPVRVKLIFDQSVSDSVELIVGHAQLSYGEQLPLHRHKETEVYRITKGKGSMILGDKEYIVKPGDYIFIPSNVRHQITGASRNVDLEFEFIFAASNLEDIIYTFLGNDSDHILE